MLKELTNSIKAILYERAVSPLSGVFLGFWILFNWKPIAVFVWDERDIVERIAYIEAHYSNIWTNFYYPILWSALFIVVYPFLAIGPYALWEKVSGWKIALKQKFESTIALSVSQSISLRKELRDKEKEFSQSMESKDARIVELQGSSQAATNELTKLKEAVSARGDSESQLVKMTERLAATEAKMNEEARQFQARLTEEVDRTRRRELEFSEEMRKREKELLGLRDAKKRGPTTDEERWELEYRDSLVNDPRFIRNMQEILQQIANPRVIRADDEQKAYAISKGLIQMSGATMSLTLKGQYLARYVY